jgi:predicted NBD/HSP70 family sugar kinase
MTGQTPHHPGSESETVLVGVDAGGTKILGGLVRLDGTLIMEQRRPTRAAALLADISDTARAMIGEARALGLAPYGIGVGVKGFVERRSGRLVQSIVLDVADLPIKERLASEVHLPIAVDNDVHAATLGELKFGIGRHFSDFVLYNAGTGLAVGMVFNHRLYRGANNYAGESGHIGIDQSGVSICACGMSGCVEWLTLEARKGRLHVPVRLPKMNQPAPSPEYAYVALNLIHIVNLLNPPAIALAGGMFTSNPAAADWVREAVRRHVLPEANEGLQSLPIAHAGAASGLVGAAALLLESDGVSSALHSATEACP